MFFVGCGAVPDVNVVHRFIGPKIRIFQSRSFSSSKYLWSYIQKKVPSSVKQIPIHLRRFFFQFRVCLMMKGDRKVRFAECMYWYVHRYFTLVNWT